MAHLDPAHRNTGGALQSWSRRGNACPPVEGAEERLHALPPGAESPTTRRALLSRTQSLKCIPAPIRKLPVEVLSIVFHFYLRTGDFIHARMEDKVRWFVYNVDEGPCMLLHVCSRWRKVCTYCCASYYASMIVCISEYDIAPLPKEGVSVQGADGAIIRACLRHYLELFSRGLFVLTMGHGGWCPAVISSACPVSNVVSEAGFQRDVANAYNALYTARNTADATLASLAQRCRELIVRPSDRKSHRDSIRTAADSICTLWPAEGLFHHLETLSIDFGDSTTHFRGGFYSGESHWKVLAASRLFTYAPRLCRLKLWRRAIHVLDALTPRLDLPSKQIKDFRCQYYDPRSCLAALQQFPSLTALSLLRYISYKPPAPLAFPQRDRAMGPRITRIPWPGLPVTKPILLANLSHLSIFCQYGCVDGNEDLEGDYTIVATLRNYPGEALDWVCAPALERLRIGFASDEAPYGCRPLTVIPTITSFLRCSQCALVELFVFLQTKETDEDMLELFRTVASLRELTLCMPYGVRLSAEVWQALEVVHERRPLLSGLHRLTLIADESPDLDVETDALADAIESRVGAHERTGGVADNLEIFQLACQGTHRFVWAKEMKTRMQSWVRRGLCVGLAVVDVALPTEFIDIRDQGNFLMDWEWIHYYDDE